MINKKITVLMPVYNGEKYLKSAIESVLDQTFQDFELLIINDGSTDNSEMIVKKFFNPKIKYIKNEKNIGLVATLNKGLSLIETEYVCRMDQDDICNKKRLELQYNFMEKRKDIDVCGTWIKKFYDDKTTKIWRNPIYDKEIKEYLSVGSPFAHPTVMYRMSSIRKFNIEYPQYQATEDYAMWIIMASKGFKFHNLPKVLLKYRVLNTGMTQMAEKDIKKRKDALKKVYALFFNTILKIKLTESELENHFNFIYANLSKEQARSYVKKEKKLKKIHSYVYFAKYKTIWEKILDFRNITYLLRKIVKGRQYDILNSFFSN